MWQPQNLGQLLAFKTSEGVMVEQPVNYGVDYSLPPMKRPGKCICFAPNKLYLLIIVQN